MDNYILFMKLTVLLLLNTVQYTNCDKFNIIPTPDSPCPGKFIGEPCLTLQQYAANPSLNNVTLLLYPGNHRLDSQLSSSNTNTFIMKATTSASVFCSQKLYPSVQFFVFSQLQYAYVDGITFNGCTMRLNGIANATFVRSSLVNRTTCCPFDLPNSYFGFFRIDRSSVQLKQYTLSNNSGFQGGIYGQSSTLMIDQSNFFNNKFSPFSRGTIYLVGGNLQIFSSSFSNNGAINGGRAAIFVEGGKVNITNSSFSNNAAGPDPSSEPGHGGAVHITGGGVTITNSFFSKNAAGHNGGGGAVAIQGGNVMIINTTFFNNTASDGGGGAVYSAGSYTNISLKNNIFSYNTAAYCGVMDVDDINHYNTTITGNTFTYNRAVGQVAGNNGGGVICIRNASISFLNNNFSHNTAAGDAGVLRVDESDVTVKGSNFSNNTAGGDGGVFYTYMYSTSYTITQTSFTDNQAGGDGGVMYVGKAGSQVKVSQSTFGINRAAGRGGAIAIAGSTLYINTASIYKNTAKLGGVASACKSNVKISDPNIRAKPDPVYPYCTLYDSSNATLP